MVRLLFPLLFLALFLSAEEEEGVSLVNLIRAPISRVAGAVNVVTGNFVDQGVHSETSGPDTYRLGHCYVSSSTEEGSIADGWDFLHPTTLEVVQPGVVGGISEGSWSSTTVYLREAGGATLVFKWDGKIKWFKPALKKTGYTLLGSIRAPVLRDARRTTISWNKHGDEWVVKLGDGTIRRYRVTKKHRRRPWGNENGRRSYHLISEVLPSGNTRSYRFNGGGEGELASITTTSSDGLLISSVAFDYGDHHVTATTSDGLKTIFRLKKLRERGHTVEWIHRSGLAATSFTYSEKHPRRVHERCTNGRVQARFYKKGANDVGGKEINVSDKRETMFLRDRVRELLVERFPGQPMVSSHTFYYKQGDHRSEAKVRESNGSKITYTWDEEHRPVKVVYEEHNGDLLLSEEFEWSREGRLCSRTIFDNNKHRRINQSLTYDDRGNVTKEALSFDGRTSTWTAEYNDHSLKTAECDPLGNWTYYEYDRSLMTARYTCDESRIVKREFL